MLSHCIEMSNRLTAVLSARKGENGTESRFWMTPSVSKTKSSKLNF